MKQQTLAMAEDRGFEQHRKPTRRDVFLATMDKIVPWAALCAVVEPHYPRKGNGRPPIGLERMLRIHFIQHWFNLADFACEEALYDSASLRRFTGIDLGREAVPDATTLLKFRHLLEQHQLGEQLFAEGGRILQGSGMSLKTGTIVDATIIAAPSSTKNRDQKRDQKRDPEMHQTRKGKQWYFGMKLHIGADSQTGLVHSAVVTAANVHDRHPLPALLHGREQRVYGDSAYASQKKLIQSKAPQAKDFTNQRTRKSGEVDEVARQEPQQIEDPYPSRACVRRGEALVGICQGPLSRPDQKCDTRIHRIGLGKHLFVATVFAGTGAPIVGEKRVERPGICPQGRRKAG